MTKRNTVQVPSSEAETEGENVSKKNWKWEPGNDSVFLGVRDCLITMKSNTLRDRRASESKNDSIRDFHDFDGFDLYLQKELNIFCN